MDDPLTFSLMRQAKGDLNPPNRLRLGRAESWARSGSRFSACLPLAICGGAGCRCAAWWKAAPDRRKRLARPGQAAAHFYDVSPRRSQLPV